MEDRKFILKVPELNKTEFIGRGAFGDVYKYTDKETGEVCAVKHILFYPSKYIQESIALENEIKILTTLKPHPRIVQYLGVIRDINAVYIYMEYMNAGSLKEYINRNGPLPLPKIGKYCKQILEGLDFLHRHNVLHRDIKGDNVLRNVKDDVKLCDFGVSKILGTIKSSISSYNYNTDNEDNRATGPDSDSTENKSIKLTKSTCGTPYFMSPEVITGEYYGTWADVWSLGATVVEMLTGRHPYPHHQELNAMYKIGTTRRLEYEPPIPLTKEFQLFLEGMLKPEPKDRATVEELLQSQFIMNVTEIDIEKVLKEGKIKKIMKLLENYFISTIIDNETRTTLLDMLLHINNQNIIDTVKSKSVTEEEIKDWRSRKNEINIQSYELVQECLLYRSVKHENGTPFQELSSPDMVNKNSLFMGPSVLEIVAEFGRVMFVDKVLLRLMKTEESWTRAIEIAKRKGFSEIVTSMLNRKKHLESQYKKNGRNRLHVAVCDNDLKMVEYILENKSVNQEEEDKKGNRAVHLAVSGGYSDVLKVLLKHNVDKEAQNKRGERLIHIAAKKGLDDILATLINYKCEMSPLTKEKLTPLQLAQEGDNVECINLLEKYLKDKKEEVLEKPEKENNLEDKISSVHRKFINLNQQNKNKTFVGKGSFGSVYIFSDEESSESFAIKEVLYIQNLNSEADKYVKALLNEIKMYTKLPFNERIVRYFGTLKDTNSIYIYMEYVEGGSIRSLLNDKGPLGHERIGYFCKQILEGIAFLHENKIIHRDIKGDNILRDKGDNVKLCDFGVSKILSTITCRASTVKYPENLKELKLTHTFCGSPKFMAPEIKSPDGYSIEADVWSLGATVIEMITAKDPDVETFLTSLKDRKLEENFKLFIESMLVKDPQKRAKVKELQQSEFILADIEPPKK